MPVSGQDGMIRRSLGTGLRMLVPRAILVLGAVLAPAALLAAAADEAPEEATIPEMLGMFADAYAEVAPESLAMVVQLHFTDPDTDYHIDIQPVRAVTVYPGIHASPALSLTMSAETLRRIHAGALTAFTAAAKASGDEPALLELRVHAAMDQVEDPTRAMLGFLQHFFTPERPERIVLDEAHSRLIHGAQAIPLYYGVGFRSAWYKVKPGQQLNEPGDTNPFPQAFVIIGGRGRARIGDREVEVQAGESYYIPPGSDHTLQPAENESLEVLWLAWGPGA